MAQAQAGLDCGKAMVFPAESSKSRCIMPMPQRLTILMCTRNGEAHLRAQLDSLLAQTVPSWDLWVSDDGSQDDTIAILEQFRHSQSEHRTVRIVHGPRKGVAANYLSLLCHPDLPRGPVALSDQDDHWMPHKLDRAIKALASARPLALYGAQSLHVDANMQIIGASRGVGRGGFFANAMVQNVISGHSAVLSADAVDLLRRAGQAPLAYHDWWIYQLVSGAGGDIILDADPVLY